MQNSVEIENYEVMRQRQGIDDKALRKGIRGLRIGDLVKLTFLSGTESFAGETMLVRISGIQDTSFRGRLASRPTCEEFARVRVGSPLDFCAANIHSIPVCQPSRDR